MASLVVALDFNEAQRAIALAKSLARLRPWLKVGLELFISAGPDIVRKLKAMDFPVFLDLKLYDIPNTVAAASKAAAATSADMLTLHLQGGKRMCQAALEAVAHMGQDKPILAGVTALTSFASGEMPGIDREPGVFGKELARNAAQWGLPAIVCSAMEAGAIKQDCPNLLCVCPGIRPSGAASQDQRRIMTPTRAVAAGADFLVVGRPITSAPEPEKACEAILTEMANAAKTI